jgi:CHAT domain-containing protein
VDSESDTAMSGADAAGREIEGLGGAVQARGAKGVIATLWPVADASTGLFMQQMYQRRQEQGLSKTEALRQAQLALLQGVSMENPDAASPSSPVEGEDAMAEQALRCPIAFDRETTASASAWTPDPQRPMLILTTGRPSS